MRFILAAYQRSGAAARIYRSLSGAIGGTVAGAADTEAGYHPDFPALGCLRLQ
jgi:hypothetical protein